jgi:hypothetical protein
MMFFPSCRIAPSAFVTRPDCPGTSQDQFEILLSAPLPAFTLLLEWLQDVVTIAV